MVPGVPGGDPPGRRMATAAGSMHPTGMDSCYIFYFRHEVLVYR